MGGAYMYVCNEEHDPYILHSKPQAFVKNSVFKEPLHVLYIMICNVYSLVKWFSCLCPCVMVETRLSLVWFIFPFSSSFCGSCLNRFLRATNVLIPRLYTSLGILSFYFTFIYIYCTNTHFHRNR